jgi:lytic murein transglycosylase
MAGRQKSAANATQHRQGRITKTGIPSQMIQERFRWIAYVLFAAGLAGPALAQTQSDCNNNPAEFPDWLGEFRLEAEQSGISRDAIAALDGIGFKQSVVNKDRSQGVFSQTFLEFAGRMVNKHRMQHGAARIAKNKSIFAAIEEQYGVPAPVLVAFWGLETDYGANMGKDSTLESLATLAFDCRRPEKFRPQLMAALKLIDRGDLRPDEMIGAWAGEIGQMQFQPEEYFEAGVDFDSDGRVDLRNSVGDVLATTANFLKLKGWRAGEPWLEEVRVPTDLDWSQADLAVNHPRSQWAQWGVKKPDGSALEADGLEASLVLPMGRNGPAFLAYPNFRIYLEWNQSLVYTTTAAYFATRLAGAPPVSKGNGPVEPFGLKETMELQRLLVERGYDVGKIDGLLGAGTRAAVKEVQMQLGLPADSYPTPELVDRLRDL